MAKVLSIGMITDTINGIPVLSNYPCNPNNYNNCASRECAYIVMHYTGNPKDTAVANVKYYNGPVGRQASAHLFVDDTSIYQSVELRDRAWHCGTNGKYYHASCRNANSIGIEQCCTAGNYRVSEKTKQNAAHLCAYLCRLIGVSADQVDTYVVRHYDVTHKECPRQMSGANNAEWTAFKEMVKQILRGGVVVTPAAPAPAPAPAKPAETGVTPYQVKVTANDGLNVRNGAGVNFQKVSTLAMNTVVTIDAEANVGGSKWGRIQGGAGYISLTYTQEVSAPAPAPAPAKPAAPTKVGYKVRVIASELNVRKGPGTNYAKVTVVKKGEIYTIVAEQANGNTVWGKLKSGVGYISLEYTEKA